MNDWKPPSAGRVVEPIRHNNAIDVFGGDLEKPPGLVLRQRNRGGKPGSLPGDQDAGGVALDAEHVDEFRTRPLEGAYPYLWLDASACAQWRFARRLEPGCRVRWTVRLRA
jgi:hypothetical protein